MAALRDDWQPSIQFKTDALDETTRLEASRELAKRWDGNADQQLFGYFEEIAHQDCYDAR